MKSFAFATVALAAVARAQLLDLEELSDSVPAPIVEEVPFGGDAEELTPSTLRYAKRDTVTCAPQAVGKGPASNPPTDVGFLNDPDFANTANTAATPDGYINTFKNLKASIKAPGYITFQTLAEYNPQLCADKCDKEAGCNAFDIFYERNGLTATGDQCPKPDPTTIIKCSYYTVPVTADLATNVGNLVTTDTPDTNDFHIVIAASNGYLSKRWDPIPGWTQPAGPFDAAINAPVNCEGTDTFIRSSTYPISSTSLYQPEKCTKACADQASYERQHPTPGKAPPHLPNGVAQSQVCSMYTQQWDSSKATNFGQKRGNDQYTITFSLAYTNQTANGVPAACAPASS
ncbi:hypothetical protein PG990_013951 [Apiospora arundinis]